MNLSQTREDIKKAKQVIRGDSKKLMSFLIRNLLSTDFPMKKFLLINHI